jgi:uncharacterized membrane protein (DUF4010 family)
VETFGAVGLMAVHFARGVWGESGVLTSAAILGRTDVDALTMSTATTSRNNTGIFPTQWNFER